SARRGRRAEALDRVRQLLSQPDLPAGVAADAHRLAAELLIDRERYGAARRHLKAAAGLEPACARTYYLAGLASERDPAGDDRRAAARFRKAAGLEPTNPRYRAAFGRAAVRAGVVTAGTRELVAAAELAAGDLPVLRLVVSGLLEAGRAGAARRVLVKAKFLRPRCAAVAGMWNRVRFEAARQTQRSHRGAQDARTATEGRPLLPFVRVVREERPAVVGTDSRRDVISLPRPHLARLRATKADR
ncbi:MAG TPA: hypothetical protein VH092_22060, partial [Urbifossiella sp.]|nr:hypothetical protein [Urbifossiella sp.]